MSEHMIEIIAERKMDRLDDKLLSNQISRETYEREVKAIDDWVAIEVWQGNMYRKGQ